MGRVRGVAAALAALWAVCAYAQTPLEEEDLALVYGEKNFVSIATGNRQPLAKAPSVATVITAEDIAAMGAIDLDEALESVPGMHVSRSSFYSPTHAMRGIQSNPTDSRMLMLQNGVPMTTLYLGDKGQNWGGLPLENVARIEIIRGPGSALYGADAYSGVINIITKSAADTPGTQAGLRAGSFNSLDAWALHGGSLGPVAVSAYLRLGSSDGQREIIKADAQTARDLRFGTHASLAPGPVHTGVDAVDASLDFAYEHWRLRAGYKLRSNLGMGAGVNSTLDPVGRLRSERISSDLSWADPQIVQNWGLGFTASALYYSETVDANYQLLPPGTRLPTGLFPNGMIGDPERYERQLRLSGYATYSGFKDHHLRFGMGHDDLDMYRTATHKNYFLNAAGVPVPTGPVIDYSQIQPHLPPRQRTVDYVYVQDEWQFVPDWTLTAGLRHDRYSDFGPTTNPRLALVWDVSLDFTAKLLYGRAFRAPSFVEQYGINPVNNGNPNLRPETNRTGELAFSWQARQDTLVNLNFFHYALKDIISSVPNPAPAPGATFRNTGAQSGSGMELEAVWDISHKLRLVGNYSHQRAVDAATHKDAGYAPRNHAFGRADWRLASSWLASAQVNWVADRKRTFGDNRQPVPDYTTVDVTVRTNRGAGQWNFAASLRNLFDEDAREPSVAPGVIPNDLPLARRNLYVQGVYGF